MPHLTETLWQELPQTDKALCITAWPFDADQDEAQDKAKE
jgi:valyl-tRNA synthetase